MSKIVICTGGFDPLHEGHLAYFKEARKLGDYLIVGVNSDEWLIRKKGFVFQNFATRSLIIHNLKMVTQVIAFNDSDNSAKDAIMKVREFWGRNHEIIFANGGDRSRDNIPEMDINDNKVTFVFGVGGTDKLNSSSKIVEEARKARVENEQRAS